MPNIAEKITTKNTFFIYFGITLVTGLYFLWLLTSATIRRLNHAGLSKWCALLILTLVGSMLLVTIVGEEMYYIELASFIGLTIIWLWPGKK